jgi:hypothetical protein
MSASAESKVAVNRTSSRTYAITHVINVGFDPKGSHTAPADYPYIFLTMRNPAEITPWDFLLNCPPAGLQSLSIAEDISQRRKSV